MFYLILGFLSLCFGILRITKEIENSRGPFERPFGLVIIIWEILAGLVFTIIGLMELCK